MVGDSTRRWERLDRWKAIAFLVGGAIFVVDTALVAMHLASGTEPGALGQGFVGAAWTAAFVGLLGMYPSLSDRSRRLVQAGAVFAVIGAITMAGLAVASFAYALGIPSGELGDVVMYFLPGVFVGIVPGFGLFAVACLRSDVYPRSVGLLLLFLPTIFLFNLGTAISGFNPLYKILGVVAVLAATKLAIGYLLRSDAARIEADSREAASDPAA